MKKAINIFKLKRVMNNKESRHYIKHDVDWYMVLDRVQVTTKILHFATLRGKVYWAENTYCNHNDKLTRELKGFSCEIGDSDAQALLDTAIYLGDLYEHTEVTNRWISLEDSIPNPFKGV